MVIGDIMVVEVTLYKPDVSASVSFNAERVDMKMVREPFEYKRKEHRRINDRGFMSVVFVITGYYTGVGATAANRQADADAFLSSFEEMVRTYYQTTNPTYGKSVCGLIWRTGDGTAVYDGKNAWRVVIKDGDIFEAAELPHTYEYVITLLEGY